MAFLKCFIFCFILHVLLLDIWKKKKQNICVCLRILLLELSWTVNNLTSVVFIVVWNRAGFLVYLVERAKKCLDFSATLYIIHIFICIIYGGWPSSITWWVVNVTGLAVMALLGEYLCIRRELREIPITRYRSSKSSCSGLFTSPRKCFKRKLDVIISLTYLVGADSI